MGIGVIVSGLSGSPKLVKGLPKGVENAGLGDILESEALRRLGVAGEGVSGSEMVRLLDSICGKGGTCVRFFAF